MKRTNVIDIINPIVRNSHIVLQRKINVVHFRVTLNSTHVKKVTVGVQAILKYFLIASLPNVIQPRLLRPLLLYRDVGLKHK